MSVLVTIAEWAVKIRETYFHTICVPFAYNTAKSLLCKYFFSCLRATSNIVVGDSSVLDASHWISKQNVYVVAFFLMSTWQNKHVNNHSYFLKQIKQVYQHENLWVDMWQQTVRTLICVYKCTEVKYDQDETLR